MSLLEMRNVDVNYGDFKAVSDISLTVEEGSIVSLIGANGAGKSTIMNTICGLNKPNSGEIIFDGQNISGLKTNKVTGFGINMVPEGSHCFEHMTVKDNLLMGAYLVKNHAKRMERLEKVYQLFPVLFEKEKQKATFLSGGQRQMLAIGRGIMAEPRLLLCDEISLGLSPSAVKDIYVKLKEIAAEGITLMIVEQDVSRSLQYSDYAYVVLEGKIVLQGKSDELDIEKVNEAYFGMNKFLQK